MLHRLGQRPVAGHIDLEPLEGATGLGGVHARVLDQYLRALAHPPESVEQRGGQGKRDQPLRRLEGAEGPIATVMSPPPGAFKFLSCLLPLVKLPLTYPSPT